MPDKEPSAAENFGDVVEEDQESQVDLGNPKHSSKIRESSNVGLLGYM